MTSPHTASSSAPSNSVSNTAHSRTPSTNPTRAVAAAVDYNDVDNPTANSKPYYYHNGSTIPNNAPQHISSAIIQPSQTFFSPGSLPRTSSLLPPPRITPSNQAPPLQDPFYAPAKTAFADPVNENDLSPKAGRRRPSNAHSRSSSLGGLSDGFRNLNRWSASTTSSRASNTNHQKINQFSRRMSVDSTTLLPQANSSPNTFGGTPRKLQKSRPSTAGGSPRAAAPGSRVRQESPARVPPLKSLPPIVTLPSLEQEVRGGSSATVLAESQRMPYFRRPSIDTFWDDSGITPQESSVLSSAVDTPDSSLPVSYFGREGGMPYTDIQDAPYRERGHSRNRSQTAKGSADTTTSSKGRERSKQPSQKAMLSKALQKANTAVQLDNAQNFEGARLAYTEACDLLHQVLLRTAGDEDRKKLEAIRKTYTSRIDELDQIVPAPDQDDKALPRRPASNSTGSTFQANNDAQDTGVIETATATRIYPDADRAQQPMTSYSLPTSAARRQLNSKPSPNIASETPRYVAPTNFAEQYTLQSSFSRSSSRVDRTVETELAPPRPLDDYMPPPLSPRKPPSRQGQDRLTAEEPPRSDFSTQGNRFGQENTAARGHQRGNSHESISWLDPIDESGGSGASSVHSRTSSMGYRRKHIRGASGDTEAEFDAALDDAIEAAYDDGYDAMEPMNGSRMYNDDDDEDVVAKAMRKVELAKERVRQSEREAQKFENERERRRMEALRDDEPTLPEDFYNGNDSDDEERMLEEMTRGYVIEQFAFGKQPAKPVPRESKSSGVTSRTWHSSMASNPPTTTTVLSTVTENTVVPSISKAQTPAAPPPTSSLPQLPQQRPGSSAGGQKTADSRRDSVRDRRLSGQNPKQLKIETSKLGPAPIITQQPATAGPTVPASTASYMQPKTAGFLVQQRQALSAGPNRNAGPFKAPSPQPGISPRDAPPTPPIPFGFTQDADNRSRSPSVTRPALRKNFSSSSLKSMKSRNLSVSNIDETAELSPGTPLSNQFANASSARLPAMPSLPTPVAMAFRERINAGSAAGGLYLFDSDIHSPRSPGEPNPLLGNDGPVPLEPCPNDVMLRPFWLMRALYQTLAHPRGGYISNKLFVPRDVWRVKGVKLRNIDEKISQCDLLTAALQKLARVDNIDADAVLEEMQSLEGVLEQVQANLTRRLGNEVGVQGSGSMFKEADGVVETPNSAVPRSGSVSGGKGSAFSWRRLRGKNSSAGLGTAYERGGKKDAAGSGELKEDVTLPSLPMTSHPTSKPARRDMATVQFNGPNANYMAALARLFDAAQTIDQIARQVEDPGLRHADKTQVGLELCTRHAAEFFGFYVCRFVLTDLTMLLDKFIKRGSEWVLV